MPKPEWGSKHICHNCGARYYDLRRDPIVCPKCNTQFDPEAFLKSRRSRTAAVEEVAVAAPAAKAKSPKPEAPAEEPEEVAEVELEADDEAAGLEPLEADAESDDTAADDEIGTEVEDADDDDEGDSDVLMEDASELGDDDVDEVVDIAEKDDPNA